MVYLSDFVVSLCEGGFFQKEKRRNIRRNQVMRKKHCLSQPYDRPMRQEKKTLILEIYVFFSRFPLTLRLNVNGTNIPKIKLSYCNFV